MAPYFDVFYREVDGQWIRLEAISQKAVEVEVEEYDYEVWITPRNELGRRGDTTFYSIKPAYIATVDEARAAVGKAYPNLASRPIQCLVCR